MGKGSESTAVVCTVFSGLQLYHFYPLTRPGTIGAGIGSPVDGNRAAHPFDSLALMGRIRLFHWNPEEALAVADILRGAGFEVDYEAKIDPAKFRALRQSPPDAVVIDLSRLPSHGRE